MSEFSMDELFDIIDREVRELLRRSHQTEPPVNALVVLQEQFGFRVQYAEEDEVSSRYGARTQRRRPRELLLQPDWSEEGQQLAAARACAREIIPAVLQGLGIAPGTEQRGAQSHLSGLIVPRFMLPTRWFGKDAPRMNFDLERLKQRYLTASYELIAQRWLDFEEPCVVAVVDDQVVSTRRGCLIPACKKLTIAEERCVERVLEAREAVTVRQDGWTSRGWPIPTGPYNRIILRSVPDDL